ncbi:IGF2 factor, partial [Polypterus senegalus]
MVLYYRVSCLLAFLLLLTFPVVHSAPVEHLCGGDLVDAINFLCGFDMYKIDPRKNPNRRRFKKFNIHNDCCINSCSLTYLEEYCKESK